MTDLNELAERVEALAGPSSAIDADIEHAIGAAGVNALGQTVYRKKSFAPRRYTASIDAAMTLVPDGFILRNYTVSRYVPHTCEIAVDYAHGGWIGHSDHAFALALTAASLRAQAALRTKALGAVHTLTEGN